ncbi:MAG TPA: 50S ribosomal protein L15 [Candidatus Peribacterales bacterium]|nr:50S ribosomal protein L15 [Candidatus Peribacterales bacterium]
MLHTLKPNSGSRKHARRVGRGNGSGRGTFCGTGCKGEQARTGRGKPIGFEGGQVPLIRRQPKLGGFRNPTREEFAVLNLEVLEEALEGGTYDVEKLKEARLVKGALPVKILGMGTLTKKFNLTVNAASRSAREAIVKAGGSVTIV